MVLARSLAQTAKDSELPEVPLMLDAVKSRGFKVDIAVLDRGYDSDIIYEQVESPARPRRLAAQMAAYGHDSGQRPTAVRVTVLR